MDITQFKVYHYFERDSLINFCIFDSTYTPNAENFDAVYDFYDPEFPQQWTIKIGIKSKK